MALSQRASWIWGPYSGLGLSLALLTLALDQGHKAWMLLVYRIQDRGRVIVAPFLDLVFTKNEGVSYGLFVQESQLGQWLLAGFAGVATVLMAIWLAHGMTNRLMAASVGLIMGGAISNAVDRLVLGGVADFFQPHAFGLYWPFVFNIADVAIVAGVTGLLYDSFILSRERAQKST